MVATCNNNTTTTNNKSPADAHLYAVIVRRAMDDNIISIHGSHDEAVKAALGLTHSAAVEAAVEVGHSWDSEPLEVVILSLAGGRPIRSFTLADVVDLGWGDDPGTVTLGELLSQSVGEGLATVNPNKGLIVRSLLGGLERAFACLAECTENPKAWKGPTDALDAIRNELKERAGLIRDRDYWREEDDATISRVRFDLVATTYVLGAHIEKRAYRADAYFAVMQLAQSLPAVEQMCLRLGMSEAFEDVRRSADIVLDIIRQQQA